MHQNIVVSIDYSRILANAIGLSEEQLPRLLEGTSLDAQHFLASEDYISWQDQHQIITNAISLFNSVGLGVVAGKYFPLGSHGPIGILAMSCSTLYESLQMMMRFHSTRAQFSKVSIHKTEHHMVLSDELQVEFDQVGQFLVEAMAVSMKLSLEFLIGHIPAGTEFHFKFSKPTYSDMLESALNAKVLYDQPTTLELIPIEWANKSLASRNEASRNFAEEQCLTLYRSLQERGSYKAHVQGILRREPNNPLTQEDVANMLNISSRTLLRKLREEGCTYQALLNSERKKLAHHYLTHTELSVEAIASCMGYHDVSSFRRAFKRWFGHPPSKHV